MGRSHPDRKLASLEPHIQQVSEVTIRKKWRKLPPSAQDRVKTLLVTVQNERRASKKINSRRNQSKKAMNFVDNEEEVMDAVVGEMTERLLSRLPRMPFPPSASATDETHFDFESTLDRIRVLESQLTSTTQSMQLLRTQIAREERMLKQDKADLERLKDAGKTNERMRKSREGRLHPLAQYQRDESGIQQEANDNCDAQYELCGNIRDDERLKPLVDQLRSHLDSMRNNTEGLKPVIEALEETQDAVDRFVCRGLNEKQYHAVYGLPMV